MGYVYRKWYYRVLAGMLDMAGRILFLPAGFRRRAGYSAPSRLLVIRVDHIGDVVSAIPVFPALKKAFPGARVDLMAPPWAEDLMDDVPGVDGIVCFDAPWFSRSPGTDTGCLRGVRNMAGLIRRGQYDAAVDLRGDLRHIVAMYLSGTERRIGYGMTGGGFLLTDRPRHEAKLHETESDLRLLEPLGVNEKAVSPLIPVKRRWDQEARAILEGHGVEGGYALVHPVPGHDAKKWHDEGFRQTAEAFLDRGITPVFTGSSADREAVRRILNGVPGAVDISGETSLGALCALAAGAGVFVGVDSGPSHLAAASGAPTVIVFGGINDPRRWAPRGDHVRVLYPGEGGNLGNISANRVMSAAEDLLSDGEGER
jgi:ADP-heptose:LPS heptosyltransferase